MRETENKLEIRSKLIYSLCIHKLQLGGILENKQQINIIKNFPKSAWIFCSCLQFKTSVSVRQTLEWKSLNGHRILGKTYQNEFMSQISTRMRVSFRHFKTAQSKPMGHDRRESIKNLGWQEWWWEWFINQRQVKNSSSLPQELWDKILLRNMAQTQGIFFSGT